MAISAVARYNARAMFAFRTQAGSKCWFFPARDPFQNALEKAGVVFIPEDDLRGPGVRLKAGQTKKHDDCAIHAQDVFTSQAAKTATELRFRNSGDLIHGDRGP